MFKYCIFFYFVIRLRNIVIIVKIYESTLIAFLATKNYKNLCSEQPFYLSNLNIFIGSNGSGKSNFISCLKFLKNCLINIPEENRGREWF
ncbi:AAA family ATPase [Planktothrix agardhii]|uniref:AAA family ATPase n=1 Tax=Planktothrix agardhii TaxID=1160 RepID=UPI003460CEFA